MNKQAYRVIFSKVSSTYIAVAEITSSQGKSKGTSVSNSTSTSFNSRCMRFATLSVVVAALFGPVIMAHAQMVAYKNGAGPRPTIDQTANGRPLVQIVTPNSSGLSHNKYEQFNVNSNGAILNNSATITQTQLGGYVEGNPHILPGNSAKIILNEVMSTNRSQLNGYIEVAGQRAEVIIANPNGISVGGGAGFINASRGVLTTGMPTFGGDGSLAAFRVSKGDIQINAGGLNATGVEQLDLIARSVQVNDNLWANQLNVITGSNQVNYNNLGVQVIAGADGKPTIGLDSSALGGMYAQKIMLVGTEAGVGVKALGNIAASAGDLTVDSHGKVLLTGKTNAAGQIHLSSNDDISNTGRLYGQQTVVINSAGQVNNTGTLAAFNDLAIQSATLNSSGIVAAGINDAGQASQPGNLTLSTTDLITATGQNTAGGQLAITGSAINLANAATSANGATTLLATAGDINHTGATLHSTGRVTATASGAVVNDAGVIQAAQITTNSAALSNVAGTLIQSGADNTSLQTSGNFNNTGGTLVSNAQHLQLQTGSLTNNDGNLSHAGNGTLTITTGALENVAGKMVSNGRVMVTATTLNNHRGQVVANRAAALSLNGDLMNSQGNIQSAEALALHANNIDNRAGRITSLNTDSLTMSANGLITNTIGSTAQGEEGGVIGGNGDTIISAAALINHASITAGHDLSAQIQQQLNNNGGRLAAAQALRLQAATLTNAQGELNADKIAANVTELNNDHGKINASQLTLHATNLSNQQGQLVQFGADASVIDVSKSLDNSNQGFIQTNSADLTLAPQQLNNNGSTISHAGTGTLNVNLRGGTLNNIAGNIGTNGQLLVTAADIANQQGTLHANRNAVITAAGNLTNTQGRVQAAGAVAIQAATIDNSAGRLVSLSTDELSLATSGQIINTAGTTASGEQGGIIGGNGDVIVSADSVLNNSIISAGNNLNATIQRQLDNTGGRVAAANTLQLQAGSLTNAQGVLDATTIHATVAELNNNAGTISTDQLRLYAINLSNQQGQLKQYGTDTSIIDVSNALDNSTNGLIQTNSTNLTLTPQQLNNNGGTISHAGSGTLAINVNNGAGTLQNQAGTIGSNGRVIATASDINNQSGTLFGQSSAHLTATSGDLNNSQQGYISGSLLNVTVAGNIDNTGGKLEGLTNGIDIRANSLNNAAGTIQNLSLSLLNMQLHQNLSNTADSNDDGSVSGFIGSAGDINIEATDIDNTNGSFYSANNLQLNANGTLTNLAGVIQSDGTVDIMATNAINNQSGRIEANGTPGHAATALSLTGNSINNANGRIANSSTGSTVINSNTGINNSAGTIGGNGNVALTAKELINTLQGQLIAAGNMDLAIASSINNVQGNLFSAKNLALQQANATVDNSQGNISSAGDLTLTVASLNNNAGHISNTANQAGNIAISASGNITNTAGNIGSNKNLSITANTIIGEGVAIAGQDADIQLQGDYINTAGNLISANNVLQLSTTGTLSNHGTLSAQNGLLLQANNISNALDALINSDQTVVIAQNNLTNQGRIYGDNLALGATTLLNDKNAVIAARNDLHIGAQTITNQDHALITSLGDTFIGGELNSNYQATGKAKTVTNSQATMDSGGNFIINTTTLNNLNPTFAFAPVVIETKQVVEYAYNRNSAPVEWYNGKLGRCNAVKDDIACLMNDGNHWNLHTPDGRSHSDFWQRIYTQTTSQDQVTATDPGQIVANGNILLRADTINNQASAIVAGLGLGGTGEKLYNTTPIGQTTIQKTGIPNGNGTTDRPGHVFHNTDRKADNWGNFAEINLPEAGPSVEFSIWPGDVAPKRLSNPATGQQAGSNQVATGTSGSLSSNANSTTLTGSGLQVDAAHGSASNNTLTGQGGNIEAATGSAGSNASTPGNTQTVAKPDAAIPNLTLPTNQLFPTTTNPNAGYLVETDPAFTNYKNFLSSDYLLGRLSINPQQAQKRLGDGFYEQKLINDQITQLTGKRFLGNYASNEQQYQALMTEGIHFAEQFQLVVGIALSSEQMSALTSDIVWLVSQNITLADGSRTQVLVPVVYLAQLNAADVRPTGAIISASDMDLSYSGSLQNSGTLQANKNLIVNTGSITNSGNLLTNKQGGQIVLAAQQDISSSGTIQGNRVGIIAGNNINLASVTQTSTGTSGRHTGITQIASVNAEQLVMQAAQNININAANITSTGNASIVAGNNLNIGTVNIGSSFNADMGSTGHYKTSQSSDVGSTLQSGGNLTLAAGQDINATASYVNTDGQLNATAGRDITITSGTQQSSYDIEVHTKSSGFLSSSSRDVTDKGSSTQAIGSSFSGDSVALQSGRDTTIQGSHLTVKQDIAIQAGRDLSIASAQETNQASYSVQEKSSGLSASFMNGISYSKTAQDQAQHGTSTQQVGSSLSGANVRTVSGRDTSITASAIVADHDVDIYAGRDINVLAATEQHTSQTGSHSSGTSIGIMNGLNAGRFTNYSKTDAMQNANGTATQQSTSLISANGGTLNLQAGLDSQYKGTGTGNVLTQGTELLAKNPVNITGNAVDLQAVHNASSSQTHAETKSVTLGSSLTGAIGGAITRIGDQVTEAQNTDNDRLKGALALKAGYDTYKLINGGKISETTTESLSPNPEKSGGGFGVSVNLGVSKSQQDSNNSTTQARGTTVQGGEINITAREGDITMEGAKLQATTIELDAAKNINLLAAKNSAELQSSNSGSSAGIGATLGSNGQQTGLSFQISGSTSKGHANGSETTYDNTQITATDKLTIKSGNNTNLIGAQVAANKVKADISGNLNIVTLQDQSNYDSKQENGGFSLSLCIPPICVGTTATGSINYGKQTVDHNYQSAVGQSGIAAGSGGFELNVKGNTDLQGAAITSTAAADKNSLQTASLTSTDLSNTQHTSSQSISVGISTGSITSNIASNVIGNLNGGAGMPKNGDESSHTNSVISPANVIITGTGNATTDAQSHAIADELTNRDAATANETLTNTLTLQQAQNLQAEQKKARENQRAADLAGAALNGMVGDFSQKMNLAEGSTEKIALHGMVGLIQAGIGGTSAVGGIAAGMSVEVMTPALRDYLLANGYTDDPKNPDGLKAYNDMMNLGATLVGAASGAIAGGSQQSAGTGAVIGLSADANNRQLHQAETDMIKKNAARFAKELYSTDNPTQEQVAAATSVLANTAQNLLDYNFGYTVPYSAQAEAFLHTLQSEYAVTSPNLSIGNGQYLFYATNDQKNSPYINSGTIDKEIAGVIIKAPIKLSETPGSAKEKRDPATNLVLDDEGRYSQRISVDGKTFEPKYFPCPRVSAGCGGQNLDMSDPQTAAYVKALDKKALTDIGTGATLVAVAVPVGTAGAVAGVIGISASVSAGIINETSGTAVSKEIVQMAAQKYLETVFGLPAAAAVRIAALIDLAGGWDAFVTRTKEEALEKKD
ncbi:hemagglutinin repeat-containing protein [Solimicrobium silvestre]|uniref:Filamentous hemagglutinin family N-terminal domain n=1 Tax=Solimicrobium silvestre TaxID=2099400 RepID=A0A2S9GSD2_9BURK|nr:hemagglutinin repeat-containing protein [Solimicrobium silvestre]PRC90621.1 Filamentous hemagglutinin family N-terminal domain [Solimicrobium silvestre]